MTIDPVSIGISLALSAASMGLQALRRIDGPRLEDTKFNAADYGGILTRFWGRRWIVPKVIFGENLKHVEQTNKTKGGKVNQHKYFGTWGVEIAPHPIAAVTRVKADGHLVLDLTGVGPVSPFDLGGSAAGKGASGAIGSHGLGGGGFGDFFRVYNGAPGQLPDERMLATVEALNGEGSCPDFRQRSWAMLEGLPLEKFGNRIPQLELESVTTAGGSFPYETLSSQASLDGTSFSLDRATMMTFQSGAGGTYEVWDVAARALMYRGAQPYALNSQPPGFGALSDGSRLVVGSDNKTLYIVSGDGLSWQTYFTTPGAGGLGNNRMNTAFALQDGAGRDHWGCTAHESGPLFEFDFEDYDTRDLTGTTWKPTYFGRDAYGDIWVAGSNWAVGVTEVHFVRLWSVGDSEIAESVITITVPHASGSIAHVRFTHYQDDTHNHWVIFYSGWLYIFDLATRTITTEIPLFSAEEALGRQFTSLPPGSRTIWLPTSGVGTFSEISLADLSEVRSFSRSSWFTDQSIDGGQWVYDPINHALWAGVTGSASIRVCYLDRIGSDGVTLRTIVEDVCHRARIDLATIDASALTQTIAGYSVAGGTAKDWLEPLFDLYDIDPRPHGFQLQFVPRGGAAGATIASENFAAPDEGDPPYSHQRPGATEVPTWLALQFADPATDQQRNSTLTGPRGKADGMEPKTIDMTTLVLPVDDAQQLSGRLHRRLAWDAGGIGLRLPSREIALEPADVRPLSLSGGTVKARLVSIEMRGDRRFETEWKRDDPSVHELDGSTGAAADGNSASAIVMPGLSRGFVLDVPLLRDADNESNPLVYLAAGPYSSAAAFPGAAVYQAVDGDYTEQVGSVESGGRAIWGYATAALGDVTTPWMWDRGHSVNVVLQSGSLTGTTTAAINANPFANLLLIGNEIVNFTTATLEADGSYTLSGFKRGRRGTQWATGGHAAGDLVLLLSTAIAADMGLSEVGTNLSFRAVTNGRSLAGALTVALTPFTGASLKPYSVANAHAVKQSNGDWKIYGRRRTRVGGAWTSGTPIPLSEASEAYEIVLGNGVSSVTKSATSLPYTWTAAAQAADVGGTVAAGALVGAIYQMSDAVGRGFAAGLAA